MPARKTEARIETTDLDQVIEEILADTYGEEEQLWSFQQALEDALRLPCRATVVGEQVQVRSIDFDGNALRGLTADCTRKGRTYNLSVLDLELADPAGNVVLLALRRWLGQLRGELPTPTEPPVLVRGSKRQRRGRSDPDAGPRSERHAIYQLKVTLRRSRPPIWRRVLVPAGWNLKRLHEVLQIVMGWTNSHLHQFVSEDVIFSDLAFELDAEDEANVLIRRLLSKPGDSLLYEYDFGDGWEHEVVLEKALAPRDVGPIPLCTTGRLACPPEDCGGVWGYYEMLDAIKDPGHDRHEELVAWSGGGFDPKAFDLDEINENLTRLHS